MFGAKSNKPIDEMKSLVKEAQQLMHETSKISGEKSDELRHKGMKLLDAGISRAHQMETAVRDTGRDIAKSTDGFVHESPWQAVAITGAVSAGIGLLVGLSYANSHNRDNDNS
jgi:ElaB/YqjD/DUF883 family membrane-anchored ribosome-binding protein